MWRLPSMNTSPHHLSGPQYQSCIGLRDCERRPSKLNLSLFEHSRGSRQPERCYTVAATIIALLGIGHVPPGDFRAAAFAVFLDSTGRVSNPSGEGGFYNWQRQPTKSKLGCVIYASTKWMFRHFIVQYQRTRRLP